MEAKTRNKRRSSLASGGFADTRKVFMLLDDEHYGEAACGPGKLGLVLEEREVKELSLPEYVQNRGRLHPRELYALIDVIFSDTNIQVYLHKKNYLSIG